MITDSRKVVERASALYMGKFGYIFGAKMKDNPISEATLLRLRKENSAMFTSSYMEKARKRIGKNAIDCSGLVCYAYDICDIGSWAIHDLEMSKSEDEWIRKPYVSGALLEADILWKPGHVGIHLNDGFVIEAKGIDYGVIKSVTSDTKWEQIIRCEKLVRSDDYERVGWIQDDNGSWWYAYGKEKGSYFKNCITTIGDKLYAFNEGGYCIKDPTIITDKDGGFNYKGCVIKGGHFKS